MEQEDSTIYRQLQRHMNEQPIKFPPTSSGSDIRLLKYFFNPQEAIVALALNYEYRTADQIVDSLLENGIERDVVIQALEHMTMKGIIRWKCSYEQNYYKLLPLVVGLDESQNYNRSQEYIRLSSTYMIETGFPLSLVSGTKSQMRTIPVEKSLETECFVGNYDDFKAIIQNLKGPIVLLDCICKKTQTMLSNPCKQTSHLDTCMAFNEIAMQWIKRGLGKEISKQEALEVLLRNQEDGLVLQPSNSKKSDFICSCCGCCCGVIMAQRFIPNPAEFWTSNYFVEVEESSCNACKMCLDRCQFNALQISSGKNCVEINLKRCVGCGNCVVKCPNGTLRLVQKAELRYIPEDTEDLYEAMLK